MNIKEIFNLKKTENPKTVECKKCGAVHEYSKIFDNLMICPECNTYMRMGAGICLL